MKRFLLGMVLAGIGLWATACQDRDTTGSQLDKAHTKAEEAWEDLKDYTFAERKEYAEKLEVRVAEMKKRLGELAEKIENSSEEARAKSKPKLDSLREKTSNLEKHLEEVKSATESTWEKVKAGSRDAYDSLREGFRDTKEWFQEKTQ